MNITLYEAPIEITFSLVEDNYDELKREFDSLGEADDDPIGNWVKIAKSKGNAYDTDPILLHLLVEMHRKIDSLQKIIEDKPIKHIPLINQSNIQSIGYEHFKINDDVYLDDMRYYGRIAMPTFPQRNVAVFFTKHTENIAKIELMHERDIKEWDAYVASRERTMIREMKYVD